LSFAAIQAFVIQNWALSLGFLVLLAFFLLNEVRAAKSGARSLPPQEAVLRMNREALQIIDVRPNNAYTLHHIAESKNIPLSTLNELNLTQFEKNRPVLLVADAGAQTNEAVTKLKALAFLEIMVLDGGLEGWKAAGFPLQSAKGVKK